MTDLRELAAEAYVYGYPLVSHIDAVDRFTREGLGPVVAAAPFNEFSHGSRPAGADDTSAGAVGGDTLCSIAQLDLSGGALLLTVPDTAGRYYVLQFVDAWTNNFAYVGRRATGTGAASFLLTPPGWDEPVPHGRHTDLRADHGGLDRRAVGLRRPGGRGRGAGAPGGDAA